MANRNNKRKPGQKRIGSNKAVGLNKRRRPFLLPAISYYLLSIAISFIIFFIVWGILIEGGDQAPWIPAGILSSLFLICAICLREVFLRKSRKEYLVAKRQLDYNLNQLPKTAKKRYKKPKFTLQQNSFMLNQLKEKSDAARILRRLPEGHLEVFEVCNEYLNFTSNELKYINKNSPRYVAVKKGRRKTRKVHKYHLLKWTELETKRFTLEAKNCATVVGKVESAQKALTVIESALKFYRTDSKLIESYDAIKEFIATLKIKNLIETAEKTAFRGNHQEAVGLYNDILFFLSKENEVMRDKELLTGQVNEEIRKLMMISDVENSIKYKSDKFIG